METVKVRCYMSTGHAFAFGRLPGQPRIPGELGEVTMTVAAEKYLRQDPRVIFADDAPAPAKNVTPPAPTYDVGPSSGNAEEEKPKKRGRPRKLRASE